MHVSRAHRATAPSCTLLELFRCHGKIATSSIRWQNCTTGRAPTYPPQVFDDLVALTGIPDSGRVLEIGCGTGQATLPMAQRGYGITAVELGENLAAIARRNLARFPNVNVQTAAFEDWPLPPEPFDLVMAATSFHWLDASVALPKVAAALRRGGAVAMVSGGHVEGGTSQFFIDVQDCYLRYMPGTPPGLRLPKAEDLPLEAPELDASGLFEPAQVRRYVWSREFTTQSYIDELNTYSGHLALSDANRLALLTCIRGMIDERYGGRIKKACVTDLDVARTR
jgi:SAM-dependent methyltransferase